MNILIDNAGFVNKGAELMLFAAKEKINDLIPECNFVLRQRVASIPYYRIRQNDFYVLDRFMSLKHKMIPNKYTSIFGYIRSSNIDALIDVGGFQFSDQWVTAYSKESNKTLQEYYRKLKSNGSKLIFLPQAFGPFEEELSKERIQIVYRFADLIYAREKTSYNHLLDIFGENNKIKIAPDFTNIFKPNVPLSKLLLDKTYIGVVPNQKMITHTDEGISEKYVDFMLQICKSLIHQGEKIILINHEGEGDLEIIKKLSQNLPDDVITLTDLKSEEVKAIIGRLKLLISSRFHGVVSGLSQGVPTFCTGWSHKYAELLNDYQVKDNYLMVDDFNNSYHKLLEVLNLQNQHYIQTKSIIDKVRTEVETMWKDIGELLTNLP